MSFQQILGQDKAIDMLQRALAHQRVHHAYLFGGPEGVGKSTTAFAFAQALLCQENGQTLPGCGTCHACLRTVSREHADLYVLERRVAKDGRLERQIRIDQVRELQSRLAYKAFENGRRVVILLEPEKMNGATANALLKTLEEPGDATHFILVSHAAHRLLPTILSRCQRIHFAPLARNVVVRFLEEMRGMTSDEAGLVAGLSEGSLGRAVMICEEELLDERETLLGLMASTPAPALWSRALDWAETYARPDQRERLPLLFHLLRTWQRDVLLAVNGAGRQHWVHADRATEIEAVARRIDAAQCHDALARINHAETVIFERMGNARLVLESMLVGILHQPSQGQQAS